ncbi:MAG: hypothetical protein VB119_11355 [Candidatus Metalachnospira sp.]|nr:hypothetical protein [Candidatus Metalachnospira sp.]
MMTQRRMLMSKQLSIEKALKTAVYVTGGGTDSSSTGIAYVSKSYLLNNQKYYLFAYVYDCFAIFKYYNGTITKIFETSGIFTPLSIKSLTSTLILYSRGYEEADLSIGLVVLSFEYDMDDIFANLSDEIYAGNLSNSSSYYTLTLSNFVSVGKTKYFFIGNSNRFCAYKAEGTTYSDLTALFNHSLYLVNYGDTAVRISTNSSTAVTFHGYTALCVKE